MTSSSNVELRRCRPLLGTFVEMTGAAPDETRVWDAMDAAFRGIERIHCLMGVHDEASEVTLLNEHAADREIIVSTETFEVLDRALEIAEKSGGAFDFTVAPTLAKWGLLPKSLRRREGGSWRDVRLSPGRRVRFIKPLAIDLGGIAKGFAVDTAIEILRGYGLSNGLVNAGGDLRVFGENPATVYLRDPACPNRLAYAVNLRKGALATSSPCFSERKWRGKRVSHLVNSRRGGAIVGFRGVTVLAPECWLADALTKVVLNAPRMAAVLLPKFRAEAFSFGS
jgi:thiamine biosynthesis lipoprotein